MMFFQYASPKHFLLSRSISPGRGIQHEHPCGRRRNVRIRASILDGVVHRLRGGAVLPGFHHQPERLRGECVSFLVR